MLNDTTYNSKKDLHSYKPILLNLIVEADHDRYTKIINNNSPVIFDTITEQLAELYKVSKLRIPHSTDELNEFISHKLNGLTLTKFGIWVYYPWLNQLIHVLPENDFIAVRTNRNKHKITHEEQELLSTKKIGIVGLSVGNAIANTIAMERICGELCLADFDDIELSNLNRIRANISDIGVPKVVAAARQISMIDPFLKISLFNNGISPSNVDDFISANNTLDLVIEVCDSIDTKVLLRKKAKAAKCPLIMDTSDRGMIDIERFDTSPDLPLFHGIVEDDVLEKISTYSPTEKMEILLKLASFSAMSSRMKYSFSEIGKTIATWPQLASAVITGGGVTTDIARRILLAEPIKSGRYYFDIEQIIAHHAHSV